MVLNDSLLDFAFARTESAAGSMLGGIVHNLNNPLHALTMQTELFLNALAKDDLEAIRPKLRDKCVRLQRIGEELKSQLEVLAWRDAYTSRHDQLVDPGHYGAWFLEFWRFNLFFKHNISASIDLGQNPPHILAVPLAITWSLEEPLVALIDALQHGKGQIPYQLRLKIRPVSDGVEFLLHAASDNGEEPVSSLAIPNEQDVLSLASSLGWQWRRVPNGGSLSVQLVVAARPGEGGRT